MKHLVSTLSLVVLFSASLLSGQTRPRAPGLQQAGAAEAQAEKNIPPPIVKSSSVDMAKLEQEADELARLAQSIPPDVQNIRNGMFPKDVIQRLKKIEKLSKRLRGGLAP